MEIHLSLFCQALIDYNIVDAILEVGATDLNKTYPWTHGPHKGEHLFCHLSYKNSVLIYQLSDLLGL